MINDSHPYSALLEWVWEFVILGARNEGIGDTAISFIFAKATKNGTNLS